MAVDCRAFWRPTFAPRNYGPAQRQPGPLAASLASGEIIFPISDAANPPSHGPCRRARNSCTSMAAPVVTFASGLALQ
jgi:hypothetical protein